TVFNDAGPSGAAASLYRPLKYQELPGIDVSNVTVSGSPLGDNYIGIGTRPVDVGGGALVDHQTMVRIPTSTALPGAGDTFAVSFWLGVDNWGAAASNSTIAAYKLNGLEWSLGRNVGPGTFAAWSGDASDGGNVGWTASCASLTAGIHHFTVQFTGTAGISNVYIDGTAAGSASTTGLWGNEYEGFTLGGRVLDARNFTVPSNTPFLDDVAIINGTVDAADIGALMTSGAGASTFDTRRLAHYAMNDASGTQITDSSANANHGTLVGYAPTTMGSTTARSANTATRTGVFGNAIELADNEDKDTRNERALLSADVLPENGDAFTVAFWLKPDEKAGWDTNGVILNWSNDPTPFSGTSNDPTTPGDGLGFSVAMNTEGTGSLIVRRSSGNYTSTGDDRYGVYTGSLDPTAFHHFAVTVDATGDITGIYVDGDYVAQQVTNGNGITDEGTAAIGARIKNGVIDSGLCAYLDDLAVISGELGETEIRRIMTLGVAGAAVPEPSSVILIGAFFAMFLVRRVRG
ncbi:MAG TPA: hypothetical protein DD670_13610, partial [Planctomycetaceae bacterium]|nr:hypothetical protein [Planctomycetaceae bacterium]